MTHEIPLTKGYVALVDDEDYALVSAHNWRARGSEDRSVGLYAHATICGRDVRMHNLIMSPGHGQRVDHRNGDGLDNRRIANLRTCSRLQNDQNKRKSAARRFKGPMLYRGRWQAQICVGGRTRFLGLFKSEIVAARAYDIAALEHFGEFANLNFSTRHDWLFPHEHVGIWPPAA
jgi:hypothetical protein